MNIHYTYSFLILLSCLSVTSCTQETEVAKTPEKIDVDNVELNLENYIPKKPELSSKTSVSDHPHHGTLKSKPSPSFPPRAEKSGHCRFTLHVNKLGKVETVEKLNCSDDIFVKHTRRKLLKWEFHPKQDENGNNIPFRVAPQKITYRLTDLNGNLVPE